MYNDLFSVGPLTVHGYGLMVGVGIVAALLLSWRRAGRRGIPENDVTNLALLILVAGFLGAKVFFLITCFDQVRADPLAALGSEGFVVYGALIFGLAALWLFCRKRRERLTLWTDLVVPGLALAQGFGRIGCFLAGCCYGAPTDSCLGVVFPAGSLAPAGIRLWPTQLFSSAGDFLLAGALLLFERRKPRDGTLTGLYLLLYGAGRFAVEFFRSDPRGTVGVLSSSQFISLFFIAGGAALLLMRRSKEDPT